MKNDDKEKKKYRHGILHVKKDKKKIKKSELLRRIELLELKLAGPQPGVDEASSMCTPSDKNQL